MNIGTAANGKKEQITRRARVRMFGRNDCRFTNIDQSAADGERLEWAFQEAPVVMSAFVTPNDPVIQDLKGVLSKQINGQPTSDEAGTRAYARAIYDYFRNNIASSMPPAQRGRTWRWCSESTTPARRCGRRTAPAWSCRRHL